MNDLVLVKHKMSCVRWFVKLYYTEGQNIILYDDKVYVMLQVYSCSVKE